MQWLPKLFWIVRVAREDMVTRTITNSGWILHQLSLTCFLLLLLHNFCPQNTASIPHPYAFTLYHLKLGLYPSFFSFLLHTSSSAKSSIAS